MTIKQLHYFIAVAETKSFTHAARNYFIAQTAMSQQISSLEKELGFLLFHRTNRMVELTEAGKVLYDNIRPLVMQLENALDKAAVTAGVQERSYRIGVFDQAINRFIAPVLKEFSRQEPDVIPMLLSDNQMLLQDALSSQNIDAFLLGKRFYTPRSAFHVTELYSYPVRDYVLAVSQDSPLAERDSIHWQDLEGLTLVAYSPFKEDQKGFSLSQILEKHGIQAEIRFSTRDIPSALIYVEAGLGCCLLPVRATEQRCHYVKMLPMEAEGTDTMLLLTHKDNDSHLTARFISACKRAAHNL